MVTETDLVLGDGRTLHVYDTGTGDGTTGLAVFWQHGTPSTGAPPEPLFAAAAERGIRWVSHDRPITSRLSVHGHGSGSWPPRHWQPTRAGSWTTTWPTSPPGAVTPARHVSILDSSVMALDWLREHASHR